MEPHPNRLVTIEPKLPLQALSTDAVLLARDAPHNQEPQAERLSRILEDRVHSYRCLARTAGAHPQSTIRTPRAGGAAVWQRKPSGQRSCSR
jgi:hypothetical protein